MIDRDKLYQARTEWIEQQKAKAENMDKAFKEYDKQFLKCNICNLTIEHEQHGESKWTIGRNAYPINIGTQHKKYGYRCCKSCDENIVLPARISMMERGINIQRPINPHVTKLLQKSMEYVSN